MVHVSDKGSSRNDSEDPADLHSLATRVVSFIHLSEKLKCEVRHSWLSSGRRESVAEHSWQMALMVLLTSAHVLPPLDVLHTLKIVLIHDLVEAEAGDVPFTETGRRKELKQARERAAIIHIRSLLERDVGTEIYDLWMEYEEDKTPEAKLAKALDNLEVQIQHNLARLKTWEPDEYPLVYTKMDRYCEHDPFLSALCNAVKEDAERKWREAGIDPEIIRTNVESSDAIMSVAASVSVFRPGRRGGRQTPLIDGQLALFT